MFGPEPYQNESPIDQNLGQEIVIYYNGVSAYGILERVFDGYLVLNPCVVGQPDRGRETQVYKMMNRPALFPKIGSVVLPVDMGTLDTILENQERMFKEEQKNGS